MKIWISGKVFPITLSEICSKIASAIPLGFFQEQHQENFSRTSSPSFFRTFLRNCLSNSSGNSTRVSFVTFFSPEIFQQFSLKFLFEFQLFFPQNYLSSFGIPRKSFFVSFFLCSSEHTSRNFSMNMSRSSSGNSLLISSQVHLGITQDVSSRISLDSSKMFSLNFGWVYLEISAEVFQKYLS